MKKYFLLNLLVSLFFLSCEKESDPYLIGSNHVGPLTKEVQINELDSVFAGDSINKQLTDGTFYSKSTEIEVFDAEGKKMLLLEPVEAFDSTSTVGFIQVLDPRYKTAKGLGLNSTFKDIVENYNITRIENTLSAAVVFIDDMNIYVTIDKSELPPELRYDPQARIQASQIPGEAKIKYFMIDWD